MDEAPTERWARRTFASLRLRDYRRYLVANVITLFGFWIRIILQGWLVFELTHSEAMLGFSMAAQFLPFAMMSPWGGALGDRYDRRHIIMAAQSVAVVVNAAMGVLLLSVDPWLHKDLVVVAIFGTSAIVGASRGVAIPVRNALIKDIVGREYLSNAIALNAAAFNSARLIGPALGGAILVALDPGLGFLVVSVLSGALVLGLMTISPEPRAERTPAVSWRQIAEAARYVRGHLLTRTLLLLMAITFVCMWSYQAIMPAYARVELAMGKTGYAKLMGAAGVGALMGALWVAGRTHKRPSRNVIFGAIWLGSCGVIAVGLLREAVLVFPILAVIGFCQVGLVASANGMIQRHVPDVLRARVMGLWIFTFGVSFPLGSVLMGAVSEAIDIRTAWCGGAILTILLSIVVRLRLPAPTTAASDRGE